MTQEESIKNDIVKKFPFLSQKINIVRPRRLSMDVSQDSFTEVFSYVTDRVGFSILCTVTGLDEGESFGLIYHLAQWSGITMNFKTSVARKHPVVKTIIGRFPNAEIYEREIVDLFGVTFEGLPVGNRYPLTDDWPADQHPLRKDWKQN